MRGGDARVRGYEGSVNGVGLRLATRCFGTLFTGLPMMLSRPVFLVLLAAALLAGCPRKNTGAAPASDECKKFGEPCLFAPGKGGVCVQRDDCAPGERCLTCQSQH